MFSVTLSSIGWSCLWVVFASDYEEHVNKSSPEYAARLGKAADPALVATILSVE